MTASTMENQSLGFFAEHPFLAIMLSVATVTMGFFDDISVLLKFFTGIGAFAVVCLTIIAKTQEIRLNREKLRNGKVKEVDSGV